ncbi:LysE family translocator [Geoalkalibacter halelectricus]|uniref:LysE family translocator n=1 Tax=Geoalkalibacter halelectricus TaxID=2847045 RepID=A0ABY5ZQW9_9BACT|nr:LysE family translocator [Geoalkalibacter halelectricus]MDO3379149.1 LysE family translocator [Geoalkalibacter halelectricus]UWZ80909.1 LysE family translocator [Geoalkalibacter halelectricus]
MIPIELLSAFFAASVLLGLAPGPDNIFVLTQSALHGKAAGLSVTLGLCTGLVVHTLAVALGVAVIFQVSTTAFTALKLVGAAYLLYLAWQAFRAAAAPVSMQSGPVLSLFKLYRRGIIMNITNPKVSIFFLAFLPQFADPARGAVSPQILMLGGFFILATILVFGGVALLAGTLGAWLNRSARTQRVLNQVAGTVFVGLALTLATSHR